MTKQALAAAYRLGQGRKASKARRAAKRDEAEPEIVKTLKAFGMSVYLTDQPMDALVGYRGKTYIVEFKSGTKGYAKGLNENQKDFASWWRGSKPVVLHSIDDAIAWVKGITSGG